LTDSARARANKPDLRSTDDRTNPSRPIDPFGNYESHAKPQTLRSLEALDFGVGGGGKTDLSPG